MSAPPYSAACPGCGWVGPWRESLAAVELDQRAHDAECDVEAPQLFDEPTGRVS